MRRLLALGCLWLACATARPLPQRVDALAEEGAACERFSSFEPRARELLDELLANAPGEQLVTASTRVNAARRACARRTLDGLFALREREGVGAVQAELDALARAWPVDRVEALLAETPGLDLSALGPLLMEARERAEREAHAAAQAKRDAKEADAQAPKDHLDTAGADCVGLRSCDAVHCLADLVRAGSDAASLTGTARPAARACLDDNAPRAPGDRAERTGALVKDLTVFGGLPEEQEARLALETLRRSLWRDVDEALAAGQPARAWLLAQPYEVLGTARASVDAVRAKAVAAHQAQARACGDRALCARLHRLVAASVGGPDEPPLAAQPGRWERGRWACRRPPVTLPDAPKAMTVRLDATCRRPKTDSPASDEYRTFELEKELTGHVLDGELRATCAGRMPSAHFRVLGFVDEEGAEDDGTAVRQEVERVLPRLVADCQRLHAEAAQRTCEQLATTASADLEQRFAESAVVTGTWASCFEAWFLHRYGVPPPPVTRTAADDAALLRPPD